MSEPIRKVIAVDRAVYLDCTCCNHSIFTSGGEWIVVSKSYSADGLNRDFPGGGSLVVVEATNRFENKVRNDEGARIWKLVRKSK